MTRVTFLRDIETINNCQSCLSLFIQMFT